MERYLPEGVKLLLMSNAEHNLLGLQTANAQLRMPFFFSLFLLPCATSIPQIQKSHVRLDTVINRPVRHPNLGHGLLMPVLANFAWSIICTYMLATYIESFRQKYDELTQTSYNQLKSVLSCKNGPVRQSQICLMKCFPPAKSVT
jgi:hypothetical protein